MIIFDNKDRDWGFLCPSYERKITIDRRSWVSVAALHYSTRFGIDSDWAEQVRFEKSSVDALKKYQEIRDKGANHPVEAGGPIDMQNMLWAADALLICHDDLKRYLLDRSGNHDLVYKNASPYWGCGPDARGKNVIGLIWRALRNNYRNKEATNG